ncbi:ATP synthase regulation protein NCA2-domain-containing protein [Aspergillus egyptiacus]|nr:ATP synthase regulation protein NCA2-domain-containing protein [Aspergillus egyptiacus]
MSAFQSKVYRLETQLEGFRQQIIDKVDAELHKHRTERIGNLPIQRQTNLEHIIGKLSVNSQNHTTLRSDKLIDVIKKCRDDVFSAADSSLESDVFNSYLSDLSWLVSAKASIHTLAAALKVFLENVLLLNEEIKYWEDVLQYDWWVGLYALQTSPFRVWEKRLERRRLDNGDNTSRCSTVDIANRWRRSGRNMLLEFYTSVQRGITPVLRSARIDLFSPLNRTKLEIRRKKRKLQGMRDFNAIAAGVLIEECLSFKADAPFEARSTGLTNDDLRQMVQGSVGLIKSLLRDIDPDKDTLENANDLAKYSAVNDCNPQSILGELNYILTELLPNYGQLFTRGIIDFGRPSPVARYWLPISIALVSGTTLWKAAREVGPILIDWISNLGSTAVDFWRNWVMNPIVKLVRTIRHDENSEIAIMSKNSLEADRASLERMVVDFVLDRGEQSQPSSSADIIVDRVREGDLTPVLRSYEKDLRTPFVGTFRGDLVRALLIQIQKTKVDVEVAMSGIDSLLKSQELVFGFVGLTPGLLISYASIRWFLGLLSNRRGFRIGRRHDDLRYALRNIHRILSTSSPTVDGRLTYKNQGLLFCNAEILSIKAQTMLKGEDLRAFQEDISDLINENRADRQLHIVERMAWTYSKWT